jgi:putative YhbY family RNA-binding protein
MSAIQLTPAQRKEMRAEAHHLEPVVMIGSDGVTVAVKKEIDLALNSHGLIKVRMFSDDRVQRAETLAALADELNAAPIQQIGKLLVLWRPKPEKVETPDHERKGAGPRIVKILKFSKSGNHRPQLKKIRVLGNERVAAGGEIKRAKPRLQSVKKNASR